jgi:hypothetical protein
MLLAASAAAPAPAQPWELVGEAGWVKMVYVEPTRIKDTKLIAQIVNELIDRFGTAHPLQFDFFDDRSQTPTTKPYQTAQRQHHRAKFNINPITNLRRFVWIDLVPFDPNQPMMVKPRETEEKLPSP